VNDHLPQAIREALAPYVPYAPPVERLNDDDAYVVDLGRNCIVRQCSAALLRSGGSIPVGLNQAVMTGMHARHHISYEQERRAKLGKPAGGEISPEKDIAEMKLHLFSIYAEPEIRTQNDETIASLAPGRSREASRMVACWNAWHGLPTNAAKELAEIGGVADLLQHANKMRQDVDSLMQTQTMGSDMNTPDFMDWLAARLVTVYGESPSADFVVSLRARASAGRAAIAKVKGGAA
jgi:hypothetical protein